MRYARLLRLTKPKDDHRAPGEPDLPAGLIDPEDQLAPEHAATGLTNPQIGERMFIAPSTVKVHLSRIYAKLGVANRVELAVLVSAREP